MGECQEEKVFKGTVIENDGEFIFKCPVCDEDISYAIDDFVKGYRCPNCENIVSFPEPEVL